MYVVPSAYTVMLSRYGAHTKQVEQTNSVTTYYCAVSVPSRSKQNKQNCTRSKQNKQNCMDFSVWLRK